MAALKEHERLHSIEFSEQDWDELWAMTFDPIEISNDEPMTRGQWMAFAHMAIGKAQLISEGRYDMGEEAAKDDKAWINQLRGIADTILEFFKPMDNKL